MGHQKPQINELDQMSTQNFAIDEQTCRATNEEKTALNAHLCFCKGLPSTNFSVIKVLIRQQNHK